MSELETDSHLSYRGGMRPLQCLMNPEQPMKPHLFPEKLHPFSLRVFRMEFEKNSREAPEDS